MIFFTKLFLGMTLILALAMGYAEYFTVAGSFYSALSRETDASLQRHQLVKYALQSDIQASESSAIFTEDALKEMVSRAEKGFGLTISLTEAPKKSAEEGITYFIQRERNQEKIVAKSYFTQNDATFFLQTTEDVSSIFLDSEYLQQKCMTAFGVAMGLSVLLAAGLSYALTRPIKALNKASKALSEGDFSQRPRTRARDEIGELTETFCSMADSLEQKMEELQLSVKQREDFIASFAHEIKTPMTGIIGYADRICQMDLSKEQMKEEAGYILGEGMRLEALSFKLLDLITLDRQDFLLEEMNMEEVLEDLKNTASPNAEKKGVKLFVKGEPGYARLEFDLFKTLLLNLTDNALKSGASKVAVIGKRKGDQYEISVRDNGRGIPAQELSRITEAFYMVDKSRSRKEHGAGLGLALCEKIARVHGCDLEIQSREEKGTQITLLLQVMDI